MLAVWGTNDMQYVIKFARMKLLLQNFEPESEWICAMLYFASCRHGAFDLSSLKLWQCGTARWPKGACETSGYHALFCFTVSKDAVKNVVRSISAKTLQKCTECFPCYSLPFDLYGVLVCAHFSQVTAFQKHWMYGLLWSISANAEESLF